MAIQNSQTSNTQQCYSLENVLSIRFLKQNHLLTSHYIYEHT